MKPAPFVHHAPRTVDEAVAVARRGRPRRQGARRRPEPDPDAQHAAGRPGHLVDINRRRRARTPSRSPTPGCGSARWCATRGLERHDGGARRAAPPAPGAAQRRPPRHPQPRHHGRLDRARRPRRRDAGRAGADRRRRRGRRRRRPPRDRRRRLLRRAARDDACGTTSWPWRCASGGSPPGTRHGVPRVGAAARRLRAGRGRPSRSTVADGVGRGRPGPRSCR